MTDSEKHTSTSLLHTEPQEPHRRRWDARHQGYGIEPKDVADSVTRCVATGVAGLSVEDATGDPSAPLYDLQLAVERIRAARHAIDRAGGAFALAAWAGFMRAAQLLKSEGSFAGLAGLAPYAEVNDLLAADFRARQTRGI